METKYIKNPDSLILQPEKTRLLQIFDMLKNVFDAAPENLPGLFVHDKQAWNDPPWSDSKGHLHMSEKDFERLRNMGLPTVHLRTVNDVSCFKIDTGKEMIRKLNPDEDQAKNSALLDNLGPQTLEEIEDGGTTKKAH